MYLFIWKCNSIFTIYLHFDRNEKLINYLVGRYSWHINYGFFKSRIKALRRHNFANLKKMLTIIFTKNYETLILIYTRKDQTKFQIAIYHQVNNYFELWKWIWQLQTPCKEECISTEYLQPNCGSLTLLSPLRSELKHLNRFWYQLIFSMCSKIFNIEQSI